MGYNTLTRHLTQTNQTITRTRVWCLGLEKTLNILLDYFFFFTRLIFNVNIFSFQMMLELKKQGAKMDQTFIISLTVFLALLNSILSSFFFFFFSLRKKFYFFFFRLLYLYVIWSKKKMTKLHDDVYYVQWNFKIIALTP